MNRFHNNYHPNLFILSCTQYQLCPTSAVATPTLATNSRLPTGIHQPNNMSCGLHMEPAGLIIPEKIPLLKRNAPGKHGAPWTRSSTVDIHPKRDKLSSGWVRIFSWCRRTRPGIVVSPSSKLFCNLFFLSFPSGHEPVSTLHRKIVLSLCIRSFRCGQSGIHFLLMLYEFPLSRGTHMLCKIHHTCQLAETIIKVFPPSLFKAT